ncbi:DUF6559 family protein [Microbulbifer sp. TYP-18]|uniref:DUF6559 family protein n=1 Tax=Microbulbifer sp. TYP-18 TaxID=3230024 RepID=UPI0034C6D5D7
MKIGSNRAIKKIAKRLPPFLVTSYGYSETYTPGQVGTAVENTGCSSDYIDHAYAMFCDKASFNEVSSGNYEALHQEVADLCFSGNASFGFSDATAFSGDVGAGDCGGGGGD